MEMAIEWSMKIQIIHIQNNMSQKVIIFDACKKETGHPGSTLKLFFKNYKDTYKIGVNKEVIDIEKIKKANLYVIAGPKEPFTPTQREALSGLVNSGGNLLILLNQGGDNKNNTNLNQLTKEFGITINTDCVIRTSFYKYFHPKEAYIHNGILNEEVNRVINGYSKEPKKNNNMFMLGGAREDQEEEYQREARRLGCDFVYVNGSTLNVTPPSYPFLSSGPLTYPSNRPIAAVHLNKNGGKLIVCGSVNMFNDDYFEAQKNQKIADFLLKCFLTQEVEFQFGKDDQQPKVSLVSDIAEIADNLKSCFQEGQEIPRDFNEMFQMELFKYDFGMVGEVVSLYDRMGVKNEPLNLIVPQFQTPLLGLAPGVFPPVLKELPNPPLELFDLDDEFSDQNVRLAQLANKCENKDIEYFVREAGDILGISQKVKNRVQPKAIVKYVLEQIIEFKKNNMA